MKLRLGVVLLASFCCWPCWPGGESELQVGFDSAKERWQVAEKPGGNRWTCQDVGSSSFAMGAVQEVDAPAVDAGIDRAWRALPESRAADDQQMTGWLVSQRILDQDTRLWRRPREGRVGDGSAVEVREISFEGLGRVDERGVRICDESWCEMSHE